MTTETTPTSEIEAVNLMLSVIGESPISDLSNSSVVDAVIARQILSEASRSVQSRGYHFNTEKSFPLVPTVFEKEIQVPLNCLRIDTVCPDQDIDVVNRGTRLYDRTNHTYQFTKGVKVDMVIALPFNELPEAARYYIAVKAARIFQARTVGSDALYKFTAQDEAEARSTFKKADGNTSDYNILKGDVARRILQRR